MEKNKTQASLPIGVFDSGVGGLTVFKKIKAALPYENIVYFGDTARIPYGSKSKETVIRFSDEITSFLMKFKIKNLVAACNTSSSYSIPYLKRKYKIPVVGVINPGAKKAYEISENGKIGVIGTKSTIASKSYFKSLKKINPKIKVYTQACPMFVPLVEEGLLSGKITADIIKMYVDPVVKKGIDTLILGCTHYPLLKSSISRIYPALKIIDSGAAAAYDLKNVLKKHRILAPRGKPVYNFFVSDVPSDFLKVARRFLKNFNYKLKLVKEFI